MKPHGNLGIKHRGFFFVSTMVVKMGFSELEGNLVVDRGKKTLSCTMKKKVSCNTFNQFSPVS